MGISGIVSLVIIALTCFISYRGFQSQQFFADMEFEVEKVTLYRRYHTIITAGFIHVNWQHLIFNMISLLFFSFGLEGYFGPLLFACLYFSSLIGGNLLALLIHRKNPSYSCVGSSGAINGVIYASIAVFPGMRIFFLPGWVFGLAFILFSVYAIRSGRQNIGHEAHLGGALTGMLVALLIHPTALLENTIPVLLLLLPTIAFIMIITTKPQLLFVDNYWFKQRYNYTVDDRYNQKRKNKEQEVDRILDKINQQGIHSLSKKERESLEEYSRR